MKRTAHTHEVTCPIPLELSDRSVIAALHRHENVLKLQPLISSYNEIESDDGSESDPFFGELSSPIKIYKATEFVTIIPGIGQLGKYPTHLLVSFQDAPDGLRSRAIAAAGVVVRATYSVRRAPENSPESNDDGTDGVDHSGWTLTEKIVVECPSWLMPLVKGNMEGAHKNLCRDLLESLGNLDS